MSHSTREAARPQELEPAFLSELIHQHVRVAIEMAVYEELRVALGTRPWERSQARRGYRNGTKPRMLTGPTGPVTLTLPRASVPVLEVLGVLAEGRKHLLALELCNGESFAAWKGCLDDLVARGLRA